MLNITEIFEIPDLLLEARNDVIGYKTKKDEEIEKVAINEVNYIDSSINEQIENHEELFNKSKYEHENNIEQSTLISLEVSPPPSNETRDQIVENALDVIFNKLNCQMVAIFLLTPKTRVLERVGVKGKDRDGNLIDNSWFPDEIYEIGESFTGIAARPHGNSKYGKTQISCNFKDEEFKNKDKYLQHLGDLNCAVASPLNGRNKTYGVLRVINKNNGAEVSETGLFSQIDLASISFFSGVISAAISNYHRDAENEFLKFLKDSITESFKRDFDYSRFYKKVLNFSTGPETAFKACILRIKDDDSGAMEARDWSFVDGVTTKKDNDLRRLNQGFVGLVAESRQPQIIEKITKSEKIDKFINSEWIKENQLESFGCFPLIISETGEVIGTLSLFSGYEYEFHSGSITFLNDVTSSVTVIVQRERRKKKLEKKFVMLMTKWLDETKYLSSTNESIIHPAYQQIIGMGEEVVPLLLRELNKSSGRWFWALRSITGEDPVLESQRGKTQLMIKAWIDWGIEKKYITEMELAENNNVYKSD